MSPGSVGDQFDEEAAAGEATGKVVVSAPARLHFGLLSAGAGLPVNFGGAGLMLSQPRTVLEVSHSDRLMLPADSADWLRPLVGRWVAAVGNGFWRGQRLVDREQLPVAIELGEVPRRHCGLGSGTQMALAMATALNRLGGLPGMAPEELGLAMGRGRRSAIGCHGFYRGGFLVDRGLGPDERFSPLELRLDFPDQWPVILVLPAAVPGSHGAAELEAFERKLVGNAEGRARMTGLLQQGILPALAARDHSGFAAALFEFNQISGSYYQAVQAGGVFHSPEVAAIAGWMRSRGMQAVVQSSWGPGLAAICAPSDPVDEWVELLRAAPIPELQQAVVSKTQADNRGAQVMVRQGAGE